MIQLLYFFLQMAIQQKKRYFQNVSIIFQSIYNKNNFWQQMSNIIIELNQLSKINLKHNIDKKYDTNRTLYQLNMKDSTLTYYLPAYVQVTFQGLANIDYQQLNSSLLCLIIFQINVVGLDSRLINYLKSNIVLYFNESGKIKLTEEMDEGSQNGDEDEMRPQVDLEQIKQYSKGQLKLHYLKFTVKKDFIARIVADVDWTPFQLLNFVLSVQPRIEDYNLQKILRRKKPEQREQFIKSTTDELNQFLVQKHKDEKKKLKSISFNFNLMDCKNKAETINCPLNKSYGNYKIALSKLASQFTFHQSPQLVIEQADQINKKQQLDAEQILRMQENKVKCFQNGHFIIPVYKIPNSTFATILFPMLLLTIINLGIFNQTDKLTGRIANLGALILAFLAIFPVIRKEIPRNPKVTKIQLMVYLLVGTDLLCFIESIRIRGRDQPITNIWEDVIFIIALIISILIFLIMFVLFILHKCRWQPSYLGVGKIVGLRSERFDHKKWKNQECDSHFMRFFDQQRIKPIDRQTRFNTEKRF